MDKTALLAALPVKPDESICLLFEAGAQPEEAFLAFKASHESRLHSLYIHPQLTELQNYGPWLLEVNDKEQLKAYLETIPGCVAVIISTRYPPSLAVQLSRGCTIVPPEGTAVLVRFYASHVVQVLANCAAHDWHASLFRGITRWWIPAEAQWQPLSIPASCNENSADHVIRLDNATWQRITDKPEITSVLKEWQTMPTSRGISPCAQRLLVIKALNKADKVGLEKPVDRMLYAICYLNGAKKMLESERFSAALPRILNGQISLSQVISGISS